jgi:hypothetical protein
MADACVAGGGLGSNFKLIKQGAEAKLYKGIYLGRPTIVKERFKKSYRHVDLDNRLTKERMKSEARAILKCKAAGNYFLLNFPLLQQHFPFIEIQFRVSIFILYWPVLFPDLFHINVGHVESQRSM